MWILNGPFDTEKPTSNDPAAIISAFSTSSECMYLIYILLVTYE
jgi:hypothetical protein